MGEGLLKRQLEGRPQKGLLRIPDCIVLKATGVELASMRAAGHIDWNVLKSSLGAEDEAGVLVEQEA